MNLMKYVAEKIKELRINFNAGEGISQSELAKLLGTATNTISRWETGNYRPKLEDLEKLSKIFAISILEFFPNEQVNKDEKMNALFRAVEGLSKNDIEAVSEYIEFRKARSLYSEKKRPRQGRKAKE